MSDKKELSILRAKNKDAKQYSEIQLSRRNFCKDCLKWKAKRCFDSDDKTITGYSDRCTVCKRKLSRKKIFMNRLVNKEKYLTHAGHINPDKAVAGRQLISKQGLAAFLDVTERTIHRLVERKELIGYNFLGKLYFKPEEVEQWLFEKLGEKIDISNIELS